MPEAPELACNRDYLNSVAKGQILRNLSPQPGGRWKINPPLGWAHFIHEMETIGYPTIEEIQTKGKFMWWKFSFPGSATQHYLHNSFGMSGGWYPNVSKHTGFKIEWKNGEVNFADPRHFGTLKFICSEATHLRKLATLGPCILGDELTREIFESRMVRKPLRSICEALMDQRVVAGIGNYLRAEILFDCRIDPWRNVTDLSVAEYVNLFEATIRITKASYESQGASIKTYRNADGTKGSAQFNFQVYSCKICPAKHQIQRKQDSNGRMMNWCNTCQK
jgi:DNA-formamidopyrimidine glycosylase